MKQQFEIRCLVNEKNGLPTPLKRPPKREAIREAVSLLFRLLSLRTFVLSFFPRGKKERTKEKKAVGVVSLCGACSFCSGLPGVVALSVVVPGWSPRRPPSAAEPAHPLTDFPSTVLHIPPPICYNKGVAVAGHAQPHSESKTSGQRSSTSGLLPAVL